MMMRQIRFFSSSSGVSSTEAKREDGQKTRISQKQYTANFKMHSSFSQFNCNLQKEFCLEMKREKEPYPSILSSVKTEKARKEQTD